MTPCGSSPNHQQPTRPTTSCCLQSADRHSQATLLFGSHSNEREDTQLKKSVQKANFHVANVDKLGRVVVEGYGQETGGDGARAGAA